MLAQTLGDCSRTSWLRHAWENLSAGYSARGKPDVNGKAKVGLSQVWNGRVGVEEPS